ncbi:MAG: chromosome segregation protein SMC [Xanthomonadales bacterium]|nr:chromosome segregation protein SMC [Xanthomonadales bacterium]
MRLTSIKLAGFKSFVDSTTFQAPTNLTGIVGPNGCGKSNIIDAVRWVMGEGSARVLRGELMSDVIFSGSNSRKPVGTATVELMFDNSDGKIGGEYASYNEISVRRQVGRDGISQYMLNGARCRRKDIKDLFLGTGLGSTSYSIIEQGMISQVVDARPEDIRQHLEEAAGISRYKDRRRETERRIAHTRDNLDRLSDLREEVSNHLSRLKRQARAAERYKKLKQQQRELESRLLALQWREQVSQARKGKSGLDIQETALQEQLAAQRASEAAMEQLHQKQSAASEHLNEVQGELYAVASDIARLEQSMQHARDLQHRQKQEHDEVSGSLKDLEQHMMLDRTQVEHLTTQLAETEPALKSAEQGESAAELALADAESAVQVWQQQFESHHRKHAELSRECDAHQASISLLDQRLETAASRLEALQDEGVALEHSSDGEGSGELSGKITQAAKAEKSLTEQLSAARTALNGHRQSQREVRNREHELQNEINASRGRLEALQAIQLAAGESDQGREWLERHGFADAPLLASVIETDHGWELAVETVLGHWLQSLVVGDHLSAATDLASLGDTELGILGSGEGKVRPRSGTLAEKVRAPDAVIQILNHVRVADDLQDAIDFLEIESDEQSAITRSGEWFGPGWIRVAHNAVGESGVLAREEEIRRLQGLVKKLGSELAARQAEAEDLAEAIRNGEEKVEQLQLELNSSHQLHAELRNKLAGIESRKEEDSQRQERIRSETERLTSQQKSDRAEIRKIRGLLEKALQGMAEEEQVRSSLESQRKPLMATRDECRAAAQAARDERHELALKAGSRRASLDSLQQSLERMDTQVNQLQQRFLSLSEAIATATDPEQDFKAEMDALLETRVKREARLAEARKALQALEAEYRRHDGDRQKAVQGTEEIRSTLERARLQQQELELNARALQKRVEENGENVEELAEALPENAEFERWKADIERLATRITRLEPVNLAAINEYEEELKRKEYMDAQNEDLTKALETLEGAIARIDRKTRTRFKDTFEEVNKGIQELFPRLFGGGHAYLELTGEDLLTTGVSIMARPPGKRVSSIHLLSGGEKALTAVAFVFAIFQLNPAPFCLLDEVDAPLDDANVGRFSTLVKEMSETVQFIVVTHNKITMEMVHQLSGVTMREPGVSRLVQVDIDEAARLADS